MVATDMEVVEEQAVFLLERSLLGLNHTQLPLELEEREEIMKQEPLFRHRGLGSKEEIRVSGELLPHSAEVLVEHMMEIKPEHLVRAAAVEAIITVERRERRVRDSRVETEEVRLRVEAEVEQEVLEGLHRRRWEAWEQAHTAHICWR